MKNSLTPGALLPKHLMLSIHSLSMCLPPIVLPTACNEALYTHFLNKSLLDALTAIQQSVEQDTVPVKRCQ